MILLFFGLAAEAVYIVKKVKPVSFGWKLLLSSLIETVYNNLRSLVIGKRYDTDQLGYYDTGRKFPYLLMNSINGSIRA